MSRVVRLLGTVLIVAGLGALAWAGVTWAWSDPFTAVYTHLEQRELERAYARSADRFALKGLDGAPPATAEAPAAEDEEAGGAAGPSRLTEAQAEQLRDVAARYRRSLAPGDAIGRLRVPRLDLEIMVVEGTSDSVLKRGPGRHRASRLPGEGHLIYVAGHRTTYSAPFSHIDRMRTGDLVSVELPYGTFEYRVTRHAIVDADAVEILRSRGREEIALQACHPRFFASHRYVVWAEPVRVVVGDAAYTIA